MQLELQGLNNVFRVYTEAMRKIVTFEKKNTPQFQLLPMYKVDQS